MPAETGPAAGAAPDGHAHEETDDDIGQAAEVQVSRWQPEGLQRDEGLKSRIIRTKITKTGDEMTITAALRKSREYTGGSGGEDALILQHPSRLLRVEIVAPHEQEVTAPCRWY